MGGFHHYFSAEYSDQEYDQKLMYYKIATSRYKDIHDRIEAAFNFYDMDCRFTPHACNMARSSGVYVFFDLEEINYVGKSECLPNRCSGHNHKGHRMIAYAEVPINLMSLREIQLIGILHPKENNETKSVWVTFTSNGEVV
jgi:hypothetical protein